MQAVLIFDGDCGFCTRTANFVMRKNTEFRFGVMPWQTPGLLAKVGLTEQQVTEAAWFVDEACRQYRGAGAVNAALDRLGGIYRLASWVYRVPGLRQIEDLVYALVARNRYRLPGSTDACRIPTTSERPSH